MTIDTGVGELRTAYLMEHQGEFPGVQITETYLRNYEQGNLAAQILGHVGEISSDQLKDKADQGYAAGDRIGQTGIEAVYDNYLRGVRGQGRVFVDALGRITSEREFSQLPEAGDNIRLTLDVDLQRAAEDALNFGIGLAPRAGRMGRRRRRHRRHGRRHGRDPRARLEPDVRPTRLRRPGR